MLDQRPNKLGHGHRDGHLLVNPLYHGSRHMTHSFSVRRCRQDSGLWLLSGESCDCNTLLLIAT
jgi:hypothetical protein